MCMLYVGQYVRAVGYGHIFRVHRIDGDDITLRVGSFYLHVSAKDVIPVN